MMPLQRSVKHHESLERKENSRRRFKVKDILFFIPLKVESGYRTGTTKTLVISMFEVPEDMVPRKIRTDINRALLLGTGCKNGCKDRAALLKSLL